MGDWFDIGLILVGYRVDYDDQWINGDGALAIALAFMLALAFAFAWAGYGYGYGYGYRYGYGYGILFIILLYSGGSVDQETGVLIKAGSQGWKSRGCGFGELEVRSFERSMGARWLWTLMQVKGILT